MALRGYMRSFNGGEVTPEFFGRIDDLKNQTGLKICRNMLVKPHGPVTNRGGTRFVAKVKTSAAATRLIRFVYSSDQSMAIELGGGYFRFHTDGATLQVPAAAAWDGFTAYAKGALVESGGATYYALVDSPASGPPNASLWYPIPSSAYEIPNPYAAGDLARVKIVQSNDIITLTHPSYPVAELRRHGAARWVYSPVSFRSALDAPTGVSATAKPAATNPGPATLQSYVVTAVADKDESLSSEINADGTLPQEPSGGETIVDITNANPGRFRIRGQEDDARFVVGSVVFVDNVGGMTEVNNRFFTLTDADFVAIFSRFGYWGMTLADFTTAIDEDTSGHAPWSGGGTLAFVEGSGTISLTGVGTCANNLFDEGAHNIISWRAVAGAKRYNVYKLEQGLYGYLGQTKSLSFKDDNIAADISRTPPIFDDPINGTDKYPNCAGYFEQRRCFAGSNAEPAYFWTTRSGTESNLAYSIPARDDDSVRFRIAARERSEIRHIVPMGNLILLSESVEWRVAPVAGEVLTPDVSVRPQSAIGVGHAQPVVVNNNLLFAAARGGHVRELGFSQQANGYVTGDICLRAPHLFDDEEIVEMAYAKSPFPVVWCVSSNGKLLGVTYVPEQEVGAWHQHDTEDGWFESICVVPEGRADVLYAIVRRTTALGTERFVERLEPRQSTDGDNGFFVDCGLSYDGPPETLFSGLDHLEGKEVVVLADGGVITGKTVVAGGIEIDEPASVVHAGLAVICDVETLPVAFEVQGYGQGRPKNVNAVWLRLYASRDVRVGPSFDKLVEYKPRTTEGGGEPPALLTQEIKVALTPTWAADGTICIRHDAPVPFTLLSLAPDYAVGG